LKLLDTSAVIALLRGDEKIEEIVAEDNATFCTCFPVQCELYRGTKLARRTKEGEKEVESLLDELEHLEAGNEAAKKVAKLKGKYAEISDFDLMIAGICLVNDVEIITKDHDFKKIQNLKVQTI
jgi:predicted nucleic acid-binding protein